MTDAASENTASSSQPLPAEKTTVSASAAQGESKLFLFGILISIVGGMWLWTALNMDITVTTDYGQTKLVNSDLADRKQTHLGLAEMLIICGVVLISAGVVEKKISRLK